MALNQRLRELLYQRKLPYEILSHHEAYTAQEVAQATHVAGRLVAKPVVVRESEHRFYMAVVAAPQHVDLSNIHRVTGRPKGRLATEDEIRRLFPDCEVGAMPPIGWIYDLPLYMDQEFRDHEDIYFQAGNHVELVKMRFDDYEKLAGPFTGEFTVHREASKIGG